MSSAKDTREDAAAATGGRTFDADLRFLSSWASPLGLLARAMLAYIFVIEGAAKITGYAGIAEYMQANGVDGRLLPLVYLTRALQTTAAIFGSPSVETDLVNSGRVNIVVLEADGRRFGLVVDEINDLLRADRGGDEAARRGIVLEALEPVGQPLRHATCRGLASSGDVAKPLGPFGMAELSCGWRIGIPACCHSPAHPHRAAAGQR